jgi:hypothetical protein
LRERIKNNKEYLKRATEFSDLKKEKIFKKKKKYEEKKKILKKKKKKKKKLSEGSLLDDFADTSK